MLANCCHRIAAHGKKLNRTKIMGVDIVETCEWHAPLVHDHPSCPFCALSLTLCMKALFYTLYACPQQADHGP